LYQRVYFLSFSSFGFLFMSISTASCLSFVLICIMFLNGQLISWHTLRNVFSFFHNSDGNIVSVKETHDIQKEVLSNLFSYREYVEEPRKRIVRDVNKKSPYGVGHVVFEPPKDTEEHKIDMDFRRRENEDGTSFLHSCQS
jgi:hypothetical protein